ncbi:MAG TPA: MFS transporter [Candidatus Sulfotelmatobacter sp.]|nr:MFS transporter [Candidatus Sulfotelmatobacter sp.]
MKGPVSDRSDASAVSMGEPSTQHGAIADQAGTRRPAYQAATTAFVALFWIVGVSNWGLPFFYDFMVQQFGWTRAQVTSGNALSKLVVGPIFGFLAGWVVDRFGPRRLMMVGILMASIALVGLGWISSLGMFYFFYLFNALGYVCGGPLPSQVLLTRWFDRSRGKAMGFAYLGIGIGGAIVPWMAHSLVEHFGWHTALQILGILIAVVSFPLAFLLEEPARPAASATMAAPSAKDAFGKISFYLITLGSMCSIAAVSGTQQNLKLFLSLDRHFTQSNAAAVLSTVLGFSIAGRLFMGWLADRIPKKQVMLLTYLLVAAGIPLLFLGNNRVLLWVSAAVFGIGLGGDYMVVPLITAEIFGIETLGRLLGVILTAGGIADAAAPWAVGHLRDVTGSYTSSCFALVGIALLGVLTVLGLPGRRSRA